MKSWLFACLTFVAAISPMACDGGTVWEDAKAIYYNNWNDANGNGVIEKSDYEYVNERAPMKSSDGPFTYVPDATHAYYEAIRKSWTVRNEDVRVLGAGGVVFTNEPCLHFEPVWVTADDGNGGLVTNQMTETFFQFPNFFTGDRYTCLFRYKPQFHTQTPKDRERVLIGFGPQHANYGLYVEYVTNPGCTGGFLRARTGRNYFLINNDKGQELCLTNDVWCEIAIIADYDRVTMGVRHEKLYRKDDRAEVAADPTKNAQGGRRFTWITGSFDPVGSPSNQVAFDELKNENGTVTGRVYTTYHFKPHYQYTRMSSFHNNWTPYDLTTSKGISGSLHTIGFWDRVLTREEIHEFFSMGRRPGVMKAGPGGTGDAGADWMRGTAGTSVSITNHPAQWRNLPSVLSRGAPVTVFFDVDAAYTNLPQLVRISPAAASAAGEVGVSIDGMRLGTMRVTPGRIRNLFVPGTVFTEGRHSFSIERTDGGTGDLRLNCFEIKGSWQLGKDDGVYAQTRTLDDFTASHIMAWTQYGYLPAVPSDGWPCDIPAAPRLASYSATSVEKYPVNFHFSVDQDVIDDGYTFVFETKSASFHSQYNNSGWEYLQVFNGTLTNTITSWTSGTVTTVPLDGSILRADTNELALSVAYTPKGADDKYNFQPYADYYRLRLVDRPRGTVIIFR